MPPAMDEPTERTPLVPSQEIDDAEDRPLPKLQIALLCYARLVEPIAFFTIFPFISQMVFETGTVDERDVGFYTGLIESLFSLTQMALMLLWGRASDRYGRKPVLVLSLAGQSIATAMFGLSTRIWQMILFRCLAGLFAGTIVTVRAMISENSTKKTEARAFSFFAFAGNMGIFMGPLIGGVFSQPATQIPSVFGKIQFLRDFPYFLPCFVSGLFSMSASIASALWVKETLVRDKGDGTAPRRLSTVEIIKAPGVAKVLFVYVQLMVLGFGYTAVAPIFWFTPIGLGGFGFTPLQISMLLAAGGLAQSIWLLVVFPPLQRRIGTKGLLRAVSMVYPTGFIVLPFLNFSLRHQWLTIFWCILPLFVVISSGCSMSFTGIQLALNAVSPSPVVLGTLNAIALTLVSATRAVSPALFSSIFATGIRYQIFGGYLIWAVLIVVTLIHMATVPLLPESPIVKPVVPPEEEEETSAIP
ncbi:MFS general substrate transporter [Mycena floridula]|nr:MFS general substrate transporter [Mycena floridula]